ncbi:MAG TPA: hypothetical protein ENN42_08210 [Thioalkalivibrio sp.]|nr:hypothetical protein [Thioalkalivibrio sp.]
MNDRVPLTRIAALAGVSASVLLLAACASPAYYPGDTRASRHPETHYPSSNVDVSGHVVVRDEHGRITIAFNERDRARIHQYYRHRYRHLPPGLARRERLPPGLERQLYSRGTLPPGLEYRRLPYDLDRQLSRLPDGYGRMVVGAHVVLIDENTRIVFDIIRNVGLD